LPRALGSVSEIAMQVAANIASSKVTSQQLAPVAQLVRALHRNRRAVGFPIQKKSSEIFRQ
jgi:hypothetical protein